MNPSLHTPTRTFTRLQYAGRSLIELLIAMLIGLIAMASVLYTISSTSLTGDRQNVQTQFNEEVAVASALLAAHFRNAGYSPRIVAGTVNGARNYAGPPVRGCEGGFNNPSIGINYLNLVCNNSAAADAIAVMYEANNDNTDFTAAGPADCLGQNVLQNTPSAVDGRNYFLIENRYFINNNRLMCAGSGSLTNPQALLENVRDLQITYGYAGAAAISPNLPNQVLNATAVAGLAADVDAAWSGVVSVRICLIMTSEDNALDQPGNYVNCAGNIVTPADRRIWRAVNMTFALRNKAPPCADVTANTTLPTGLAPNRCGVFNNLPLLQG